MLWLVGAVMGGSVMLWNREGDCAVVMMGDSDTFGNCGLVVGAVDVGLC